MGRDPLSAADAKPAEFFLNKFRSNPAALAFFSGVLFFLSFPPFPFPWLAWFSGLPLFEAVSLCRSRRQAVFLGFFSGLVFFIVSIQWLSYVTSGGWILLSLLEAAFFAGFAWVLFESRRISQSGLRVLWIALGWTSLEWCRGHLPVFAFGWNLLAHSQAPFIKIIQPANTIGVYGLGFLMMLGTGILYEMISVFRNFFQDKSRKKKVANLFKPAAALGIFLALLFSQGVYHSMQAGELLGTWRIALVQGNIPQAIKWEPMARDKIVEIYMKLTELASYKKPDLIIWPEAAFPGYFNRDFDADPIREMSAKLEIPFLLGSPHYEDLKTAYNSAYLLGPDGETRQRYDKQILVPFGEYIPMKWMLGWLAPLAYSMGVSDFSAGTEKTIFGLMNDEVRFSVLICFEDTFPDLARDFVGRGAAFLAVITNDAWFGHTGAPYQHLQASIFRAVENGVPVVRAANTGVSAVINNRGRVLAQVEDEKTHDPLFVTGQITYALPVEVKETVFRRGGWTFPYAAMAAFLVMTFFVLKMKASSKQ